MFCAWSIFNQISLKNHHFYFLAVLSIFLFSGLLTENCVPLEHIMFLLLDGSHVQCWYFSHLVNKFFFVCANFIVLLSSWNTFSGALLSRVYWHWHWFQPGTVIHTGNVCSCFSGLGSSCRVVIVDTGARFLSIPVGFLWAEMLWLANVNKMQLAWQ